MPRTGPGRSGPGGAGAGAGVPEALRPITEEERGALAAWIDAERLPAVPLLPGDGPPTTPLESRIGGRPWAPYGGLWPKGANGRPMIFIAQVNLADLPALPDFPEAGLVQLFVSDDDLNGLDFEAERHPGFELRWYPEPEGGALLPLPAETPEFDPVSDPEVRREGRVLRPNGIVELPPSQADWRLQAKLSKIWKRPDYEAVETWLETLEEDRPVHFIGGHPQFTQSDVRSAGSFDDHDRVVMQFGFDDIMCWGDAGEATVLIRAEDLRARDFSRVIYSWDCG